MKLSRLALAACLMALSPVPFAAAAIPMAPLAADWTFSADGGKTYALTSLPAVPARGKTPVVGRCTFTVDDPATLGVLWFATRDPEGGICPAEHEIRIGHRYLVMPLVLLKAKLALNGKPVPFEIGDVVFRRIGIDPRLLKKGANVITFSGDAWNSLHNAGRSDASPAAFRLATSPPDALALRAGPVLGPIDEDAFSFAARTHIPCELEVTVTPVDPAAEPATHAFPRGTIHRVRAPVPGGTRKFRYSVTAKNGAFAKTAGPYEVRVPDARKGLRFLVLGQTACNDGGKKLAEAAEKIGKLDPDFIIHTGSVTLMAYWDFYWDDCFFRPWHDLLTTTPICLVPAYKDLYSSAFGNVFYHPGRDGRWYGGWSWAFGNVRFIGVDGMGAAGNADSFGKWIEAVLKESTEDYVFYISSYPAFTTHGFGRGKAGYDFGRNVAHPLLAKFNATAELGCTGKYEYVEPPKDKKGVPAIITGGVGSPMAPGWNHYQYCLFEIRDGKCHVTVIAYETGQVLDRRAFAPRKAP